MNLYDDEENPLLVRPRPFWEEEPVVIAKPVVEPPVAPPAAPPPEVVGPGYASLEDIPVAKEALPPPEVVGPGYASLEDVPEKPPEVEERGYASLEEAGKPTLRDVAALGYRTMLAPFTQPVETAREATEGIREQVVVPEGTRRAEFVNRIKRNFATGMEEEKAGTRQMAAGLLRAEQNPYVGKSVAEAKADIPMLEQQIADTEKSLSAAGGDPSLSGMEWYYETAPENREQSQKLTDLRTQLMRARESATGVTTESFAGTLSRSFEDVAQENRARQAEIIKEYGDRINESHNKEIWMQVADSLGSSAPSMGAAMLNPVFGLGLMYAQTFETSREEFLKKGGDPAKADEYAHVQAALQTPLEVLGELPVAGIAKGALKRLVKEGSPESWAKWIKESAVELGKAEAGEVGITTPGQTIIEQKVGEKYGVKPVKTGAELAADVLEAQKVAALQVGVAGGGPLAVEAGTRLAAQSIAAPPALVPPVVAPGTVPPVTPPGVTPPTPPEAFAPPVTPPGVMITPAPSGEVPGAQPPLVPFEPGQQVTGPVEGLPGVVTGMQPDGMVVVNWADGNPPQAIPPEHLQMAISPDSAGKAVVTKVQGDNTKVEQIAADKAQNLQASAAPKTAQAIQQVAQSSNQEASVTAAEFLRQAQIAAATPPASAAAAPEAPAQAGPAPVTPAAPAVTGDERFAPPAPAAAPAVQIPTPIAQAPTPSIAVGGQVFTGATHADAVQAAQAAVGPDAIHSAETGWVDPETGQFVTHAIYDAHVALNTAMEQSGGNPEAPVVQQASAQLAQAHARNAEINSQIVAPSGEQVVQTGVNGQVAVMAVRPSRELAVPLAGVNVTVEGITPDRQPATAQRPAAQVLNEARNDKTALTILLDCIS